MPFHLPLVTEASPLLAQPHIGLLMNIVYPTFLNLVSTPIVVPHCIHTDVISITHGAH